MKKAAEKFNFAEAFKELEGIVEWFETQDVDLEEGLQKFERGLEIAKLCRGRLKEVENKVSLIKAKFSGIEEEDEDDSSEKQPSLL